jgi:hypothetical protein
MSNGEIGWMFGAFLLMAGAMLTGLSATDTRAEPFFLGAPLAKYEFQRDLENFRDGALQNLDATYMTLKAIPVTFLAEIATVVLFLTFLIWIIPVVRAASAWWIKLWNLPYKFTKEDWRLIQAKQASGEKISLSRTVVWLSWVALSSIIPWFALFVLPILFSILAAARLMRIHS